MENTFYHGDCLFVLRHDITPESIDLIYLDPPFNSQADYNVLFKEVTGEYSEAQITAFEDTWHWTPESERTFSEIVKTVPANVVEMIRSFVTTGTELTMTAFNKSGKIPPENGNENSPDKT